MDTVQMAKAAQMDLLIELDRICRKYEIPYFLAGGTLIGAIRHNGFIPWDDDIDVALFREHYDRLIAACEEDLDPAYEVHDWHRDPNSPHGFMKLKIRGTHYPEGLAGNSKMTDGIYIDIFPYDSAPDDPKDRKKQAIKLFLLKKILLVHYGFDLSRGNFAKRLIYGALRLLSKCRKGESWKKSFEKVQRMGTNPASEFVICTCGSYSYDRELQPREILEGIAEHIFEGYMCMIPEKYDAYLRSNYGDYMQLPPEDRRAGKHEIVGIDFGDYQIRYNKAGKEK